MSEKPKYLLGYKSITSTRERAQLSEGTTLRLTQTTAKVSKVKGVGTFTVKRGHNSQLNCMSKKLKISKGR